MSKKTTIKRRVTPNTGNSKPIEVKEFQGYKPAWKRVIKKDK